MKKKNFVSMILGTVGGLLFAIGMCMCMLPEWNAFTPGAVTGALGAAVLIAVPVIRRKMEGKAPVKLNARTIGTMAMGAAGALIFGTGMCMVMVWDMMIPGIAVGIVGIVLLLCLIPVCKGLK